MVNEETEDIFVFVIATGWYSAAVALIGYPLAIVISSQLVLSSEYCHW